MRHDAEAELLGFFAFAMMVTGQGDKALGQTDETDAEGAVVDDRFDGAVGVEGIGAGPQARHEQWELLYESRFLEIVTVAELSGGELEQVIEFGEEGLDALLGLPNMHTFDGEAHDVDGGEGEVAAGNGSFGAEAILEHAGAAAHGGYFVEVALWVIGAPLFVLIESSVKVEEVGEEAACGNLAGELVEVVVGVTLFEIDTAFLLPDLDGENGRSAVADPLVSRVEEFADNASSFG